MLGAIHANRRGVRLLLRVCLLEVGKKVVYLLAHPLFRLMQTDRPPQFGRRELVLRDRAVLAHELLRPELRRLHLLGAWPRRLELHVPQVPLDEWKHVVDEVGSVEEQHLALIADAKGGAAAVGLLVEDVELAHQLAGGEDVDLLGVPLVELAHFENAVHDEVDLERGGLLRVDDI